MEEKKNLIKTDARTRRLIERVIAHQKDPNTKKLMDLLKDC